MALVIGISACGRQGLRPADRPLDAGHASTAPTRSGGVPGSDDAGAGGARRQEKPRVLLIDPSADQLQACDADGRIVADYRFALDFGDAYGRQPILSPGQELRLRLPIVLLILTRMLDRDPVDTL